MTKQIPLTQGKVALVDDDVYEWASKYKWYAHKDGRSWYAKRKPADKNIALHREIMQPPPGLIVDHINGDGLDCRRSNMRLATRMQNARNSKKHTRNKSGYKGVHWCNDEKMWHSQIQVSGRKIHLGTFVSPEAAARAYDEAARKYHGEFANTNF